MFARIIAPLVAATILIGCAGQTVPPLPGANHPASVLGADTPLPKRSATLRGIEPVAENKPAEADMKREDGAAEDHHHGH